SRFSARSMARRIEDSRSHCESQARQASSVAMERVPLRSRAVASVGYDADTRALVVEFSSGRVYRFRDVPASVYDSLLRVPNKGVYVARSINGRYEYEDVTRPAVPEEANDLEGLLQASLLSKGKGL